MPLSTSAKNTMLGAISPTHIRLHNGSPGADGTANAVGSARFSATFGSASSGERQLTTDVLINDLSPSQAVTHFSAWTASSGGTFLGSGSLTGDSTANASGEYTLKATSTKFLISDPA